jgi:hypothetical protein
MFHKFFHVLYFNKKYVLLPEAAENEKGAWNFIILTLSVLHSTPNLWNLSAMTAILG